MRSQKFVIMPYLLSQKCLTKCEGMLVFNTYVPKRLVLFANTQLLLIFYRQPLSSERNEQIDNQICLLNSRIIYCFCKTLQKINFGKLISEIKKVSTMNMQIDKFKGPGVYFPPPLLYVLIFILALFIQRMIPIADTLFHLRIIKAVGIIFLIIALFFLARSLRQFFQSKNTVILFKPALSLQKTGIYGISRNPMYVGLVLAYIGITCSIGNWWNIILFPILFVIVQEYIIKREEKYLELEFGQQYIEYKKTVRRWL